MKPIEINTLSQKTHIDPDQAPIFIIGSGRSGTTLLRQILSAHPNIHICQEAGFFLGSQFVPSRANTNDWMECYFRSYFFAGLNIDAQVIRKELTEKLGYPVSREYMTDAYRAIMRCVARKYRKTRYGDKTPLNSLYLERIFKDFPNATVIHMVRDPRATIYSLSKMPWASGSIIFNTWYYYTQISKIGLYGDRILEIRLEDLVTDTKETLERILQFVGEPWHDAVMRHTEYAPVSDMRRHYWLSDTMRPVHLPENQWLKKLDPAWIWFIEKFNSRLMKRYGYAKADNFTVHPSIGILRLYALDMMAATISFWRLGRLIIKMSGKYPDPPAEVEQIMVKINSTDKPGKTHQE